jgi:hypothetical protein
LSANIAGAAGNSPRNVDGIQDNSFLLEEAYNQGPGEVQHILTGFYNLDRLGGRDDEVWELAFSQEWPLFGRTHQLAYTVPYVFTRGDGGSENGLADMEIQYRYQALYDEEHWLALAPSFSLILPTGDEDDGLGDGTVGYSIGIPFSTAIGDKWFWHLNAGVSWLPDAGSGPERDLIHYDFGTSFIFAAAPTTHLLLEWLGSWEHENEPGQAREREFLSVISPGVRHAFDFPGDKQLVLGLAAPIGVTGSAADYGVFLYVSFEHLFMNAED